jgi:hypothetical protein
MGNTVHKYVDQRGPASYCLSHRFRVQVGLEDGFEEVNSSCRAREKEQGKVSKPGEQGRK